MSAAASFARRVLTCQALVGVGAYSALAALAPGLIVLEWDLAERVLSLGIRMALVALGTTAAFALARLHAHRNVLHALAHGSGHVVARKLGNLAGLPGTLTLFFFIGSSLVTSLFLVPGVRPDKLDDGRAISLFILAITILGASALFQYALLRAATIRILELAPLEPITALLERAELRRSSRRRVIRRLLLAVVAPVALVGVGAVLVSHAHLRTLTEQTKKTTAILLTRMSLDPGLRRHDVRQENAIAAAAEFGFLIQAVDQVELPGQEPSFQRESDGQIVGSVPLGSGQQGSVRFSADLDPATTTAGVALALIAALAAAFIGSVLGKALASDLVLATQRVRLLGTESVLRGATQIARPARFLVVARLGRAIEILAERFRIFAAAQERALEAREAAQRTRGLLFASVSHDLKSPLNAILGFADLVAREELSSPQRESLALISTRGRELLALIEAILDTARVEAGQLTLHAKHTDVATLLTEAARKARDLAGEAQGELVMEVADGLPSVPVDTAYVTRALAVIIAHAMRSSAADPAIGPVCVRAARHAEHGDRILLDIEHAGRSVSAAELDALFTRRTTSRGRGLTLGLSLARSIIELHGGSVDIDGAHDRAPVVHCWLPLLPRARGPSLSGPARG